MSAPEARAEAGARALARERGLERTLSRGQVVMIGLGGAIGTGLFAGSALAIGYAGPAVTVSFVLGGLAALAVVLSLSEMTAAHPTAGAFGVYAEIYLGPLYGFLARALYWAGQVVATGGEAVAAGAYMSYWTPGAPTWLWALAFAAAVLVVNARSVSGFARFEYWFSLIKVAAILAFIVLGLVRLFGPFPDAPGLKNLWSLPGGFAPHGLHGIWMAVIMAVFSYNGVELLAVTAGEAREPERAIPAALRSMVLRLFVFYVLSLAVAVAFVPWTQLGGRTLTESPFVRVFGAYHLPFVAGVMNFVILTAALSSMNTNVYLASRMLFSLARDGSLPRRVGALSRRRTPVLAVGLSSVGVLASAAVSAFTPKAYGYLMGIALFGAMAVWILILLTHIAFRRARRGVAEGVRAPFFPAPQILGLGLVAGVLVTMGLDPDWRVSWIVGLPFVLLLVGLHAWRGRGGRPLPGAEEPAFG